MPVCAKLFISLRHATAWFLAYFRTVRPHLAIEDPEADFVDAAVDLGVLKHIVNQVVSDEDATAFGKAFKFWFQRDHNPIIYENNSKDPHDPKAELKAVLICLSFSLMNVADPGGEEKAELIPYLQELKVDTDYFSASLRCLAWILFGISECEVTPEMLAPCFPALLSILVDRCLTAMSVFYPSMLLIFPIASKR